MTQFNTIIIMLSMFKVLLLAACVAFVVGEDDYYLDAGTPPATTTTADQVATTTTAVAATTTTTALSIFRCKECDDWMACAGNHFLTVVSVDLERVPAVDGTNGDCAKTTGILNPLLSAAGAGTACHGGVSKDGKFRFKGGYIVNVGYEVADNCNATADAINQKIAGAAVVAKVACVPPSYLGNMLSVPGDITACKPVACALNDVVGAFDPDCPVPTTAAATTTTTAAAVPATTTTVAATTTTQIDCESAEAVACQEHGAMCLCMVPGGTPCSAEAVTACSDVAKGLECKKRDSAV